MQKLLIVILIVLVLLVAFSAYSVAKIIRARRAGRKIYKRNLYYQFLTKLFVRDLPD